MKTYNDFEPFSKDQAYWERNQLVVALSKIYPSHLCLHSRKDKNWDKDWRWIVCIHAPIRHRVDYHIFGSPEQLTWHIHKDEKEMFSHLKVSKNHWDGHTTEEKYDRLKILWIPRKQNWFERLFNIEPID